MSDLFEALRRLPGLRVERDTDLSARNRFGLGGRADFFAETCDAEALASALEIARESQSPVYFLGEGSNIIVADDGFRGLILRYIANRIRFENGAVRADAGASLQRLVDFTIDAGLTGLHTLERIPGSVGGAVYGNAGAYGRSIDESVRHVTFLAGGERRVFSNEQCDFSYRESVFKRRKEWILLDCWLEMPSGDPDAMREEALRIRRIRDEKFPPAMRCAGSIFKNLRLDALPAEARAVVPPEAVRGGKVASAFFLEKVGAKGMERGGIRIPDYHANILYNAGGGTATDLAALVAELKRRVADSFGFSIEEEVQYVGQFR